MQGRKKVFEFTLIFLLGGVDCFAHHPIQAIQLVAGEFDEERSIGVPFNNAARRDYQNRNSRTLPLHRETTVLPPTDARRSLTS
jgi:hypothetical protein